MNCKKKKGRDCDLFEVISQNLPRGLLFLVSMNESIEIGALPIHSPVLQRNAVLLKSEVIFSYS
jgi:hypothetical protein